jgi:branched-chain amino acid transport system ATP-binding protein
MQRGPRSRRIGRAPDMLEVEQLVVRYGAIEAVKGISLHVDAGEMVALIGGNGAGKTSTLLTLSGALPSAAGIVRLDEIAITRLPAYRIARLGVAQVVEGRAVFATLSVRDNLLAGAYARHDTQLVGQDLEAVLERFPRLRERLPQAGGTLSGGEQQMLAIARALMSRPRILLLDEPSMGLAPMIAQEIFELLAQLNREGLTVLLVEQNAVKALTLSTRAYVMAHGEIVASGDSAALLADKRVLDAYLGVTGDHPA